MESLAVDFISIIVLDQTLENESQNPGICLISVCELSTKIHRDHNKIKFRVAMSISENTQFLCVSLIRQVSALDH